MVIFAVIGDGTGRFQTLNFNLFKPEKDKLAVYLNSLCIFIVYNFEC